MVSSPGSDEETKVVVADLRLGWTRSTDVTILGSGPVALPFSVSLPTTDATRLTGKIASFRFQPSITWEFNPTYSLNLWSQNNISFSNAPNEEYAFGRVIENATYKASHALTLAANLTDWVSISQSVGTSSSSKNLKNILGMEQVGASLDISSGASFVATPALSIDVSVNQSAPLQGSGNGTTKVYDNNLFRLYHIAQTSYNLTGTYAF